MKTIEITNPKKVDYLSQNGIYPVEELYNGTCYYWNTKELRKYLTRYQIENYLLPNKQIIF